MLTSRGKSSRPRGSLTGDDDPRWIWMLVLPCLSPGTGQDRTGQHGYPFDAALTPPSCSSFFSCTNAHRVFKDQLDRIYHLSLPGPPSRQFGVGMASMVRLAGLDLAVPASP